MGSDESRFNVPLPVRGTVIRLRPQITIFEEKGEPRRNRTEALTAYQPKPVRLNWDNC